MTVIIAPNGARINRPETAALIDLGLMSVYKCRRCGNWVEDGTECLCPRSVGNPTGHGGSSIPGRGQWRL